MKNRDLLIFGAVGVALWWIFGKAHAISTLIFIPRGVSFNSGAMQIQVGVQNPTSAPLSLRSIAGSVYMNGNPIGNLSDFQSQLIAPNQETVVNISVAPNVFGLAQLAVSALKDGISSASFSVSGYANVDNNTFPVNFNFSPNI